MRRLTESAQNDNEDPIGAIASALERAMTINPSDTFAERERRALQVSNEAVRMVLERSLQMLADAEAVLVHHDEHAYKRHQQGTIKYHSLCGPLSVRRWTFRAIGVRNGPTIVPLDLRAGLIENATPALAYAVARGYAKVLAAALKQICERHGEHLRRGRRSNAWARRSGQKRRHV